MLSTIEVVDGAVKSLKPEERVDGLLGLSSSAMRILCKRRRVYVESKAKKAREELEPSEPIEEPESLYTLGVPEHLKSLDDEVFLQYDSGVETGPKRCMLFATQRACEFLSSCSIWLADGHFSSCPKQWLQVYIISGLLGGHVVPE